MSIDTTAVSFSLLFGPSQRGVAATMPSADCCVPRPWPLDSGCFLRSGFTALPGYLAITSPFITATSTSRLSGQVSDFSEFGRLISIALPCMWFLFIGATFCLRLPSDSASRQTPLACSYASPCRVRVDLNRQVIAPCRAHQQKARRGISTPGFRFFKFQIKNCRPPRRVQPSRGLHAPAHR